MTQRDGDDDLLRRLGQEARELACEERESGLEELVHGVLPREREQALRALAERDPIWDARVEAYRPLSEAEHRKIAERVRATMAEQPAPLLPWQDDEDWADIEQSTEPARPPQEVDQPNVASARPPHLRAVAAPAEAGPRRTRWMYWTGALAAAAAVLLLVRSTDHASTVPLPAYALEIAGAVSTERGSAATSPGRTAISDQTRLLLTLRPAHEVRQVIDARVYAIDRRGKRTAWPSQSTRAASGALRLALAPAPLAPRELAGAEVWVGPRDRITQFDADAGATDGLQRLTIELIPASD